jgi:signal transduction histidine kinase
VKLQYGVRHAGVRHGLIALAVLAFALLWGSLAVYLRYDKAQVLANANRNGANLSRAFAEHVGSTLRTIDQTLRGIVHDYEQAPAAFDAVSAVKTHALLNSITFQIVIIGPDGYMALSNLSASNERIYLGDREHFRVHAERDTHRLFISKPLIGRVSGRWSIQLSRRINKPDGSFGGVMLMSLDPQYLSSFYDTIDIGPDGVISVVGQDGIVRARKTGRGTISIGQDLTKAALWTQLALAPAGHYEEKSILDGVVRLFNYRTLSEYPLLVNVGLARTDVLRQYARRRDMLIAAAVAISAMFAAVVAFLGHQIKLQVRTEAALRRHEQELIASRNDAHLANRAKSEFLANMSHELRTPLNAIIGFSEFMASGALGPVGSPRYLEYARDINNSGRHLLDMISDILDMSKIEAGQYELAPQDVDLATIAAFCVKLVAGRAEAGHLTIANQIGADIPALRADQRALRQIVLNLLSNAVKFTPPGGTVTVSAVAEGEAVRIVVADTGMGISPADLAHIAEPFRQAGEVLNRPQDGTGLGLAITKRLVEMHGGRLEIQSAVGQGTTVSIILPIAPAASTATAVAVAARA